MKLSEKQQTVQHRIEQIRQNRQAAATFIGQETFHLDTSTPHGKWAFDTIQQGSKSMDDQSAVFMRMMNLAQVEHVGQTTADHVLKFLYNSSKTCLPQTTSKYMGHIRGIAARANLSWVADPIWPLLNKGLRVTAPPRKHAQPVSPEILKQIHDALGADHHLKLATTFAVLGGCRLDEVFRFEPDMMTCCVGLKTKYKQVVERGFRFVMCSSGVASKTGILDPDDLRFVDIILLNDKEHKLWRQLKTDTPRNTPIFQRRAKVTALMNQFGLTDHSYKAGTALMLSELIRDEILPEETLPMILKHKSSVDPISSTTAGYLGLQGRANLLQSKYVFEAAMWLRKRFFHDI